MKTGLDNGRGSKEISDMNTLLKINRRKGKIWPQAHRRYLIFEDKLSLFYLIFSRLKCHTYICHGI